MLYTYITIYYNLHSQVLQVNFPVIREKKFQV